MEPLKIYAKENVLAHVQARAAEQKIGQLVQLVEGDNWRETLLNSRARFVLVGIAEDIGVRANGGRPGAAAGWSAFLTAFLNFQDNLYLHGGDILLLGEIDVEEEMRKASTLGVNLEQLRELTVLIDDKVAIVVQAIIEAGKIPIVIGGGHNNSYGNLQALSEATKQRVNCLNIDAHTDLRRTEGRHSGNGFSYAMQDGFLDKYYVFGVHENYTPHHIFEFILANHSQIGFTRFDAILTHDPYMFEALDEAIEFLGEGPCGFEIDMDCIMHMPSSAMSPDGFLLREVRQIIRHTCRFMDFEYLHICEGAPNIRPLDGARIVGRGMAYLVGDFIKWNTDEYVDAEDE